MCDHPLLSVIVPVYNVESYLSQCLDSLLAQDISDYEVILVDDGSTDNSGAICDRCAAENPAFQCIHKPNGGLPSARKAGYQISRGQYVTFVDSDDWIAPDMYKKMCAIMADTHADIIICNHTSVTPKGEIVCRAAFPAGLYDKTRLEQEIYPYMIYSGSFFKYGISPNLWNKAFRRELLGPHLFHVPNDIVVGEDTLASYSCMLEAESIYFLSESLYFYRSNADSLSRRAIPTGRLAENHKMFDILQAVIDTDTYPYMQKQLQYFFVYQSLLTFVPVFASMRTEPARFRRLFLAECKNPHIRESFKAVPLGDITGLRNRVSAFCVRHRLPWLFKLFFPAPSYQSNDKSY